MVQPYNSLPVLKQFLVFFVNGCLPGLIALRLQQFFYFLFGKGLLGYALSSAAAYRILIIFNYFMQYKLIFNTHGAVLKFILSNILMMILVSILSVALKWFIFENSASFLGDLLGFAPAPLSSSAISFLVEKLGIQAGGKLNV